MIAQNSWANGSCIRCSWRAAVSTPVEACGRSDHSNTNVLPQIARRNMLQDALELANASKMKPDIPRSERKVTGRRRLLLMFCLNRTLDGPAKVE